MYDISIVLMTNCKVTELVDSTWEIKSFIQLQASKDSKKEGLLDYHLFSMTEFL